MLQGDGGNVILGESGPALLLSLPHPQSSWLLGGGQAGEIGRNAKTLEKHSREHAVSASSAGCNWKSILRNEIRPWVIMKSKMKNTHEEIL